jgi:tetratricopeptide (TPR) repeat protein
MPMRADRAQMAWDALQAAVRLARGASPVEQALISALAHRHQGPQPLAPQAQQPLNEAFASAMREVARRFPNDLDVQTLFAESLMNLNPWKLWTPDGKPAPHTEEIVATLEGVLARNPNHPGANHYYIHATEASPHPEKALASAERLPRLMPGAGHLVHMPSHIYQRLGRYENAAEANRRAIDADSRYLEAAKPSGTYSMYVMHNHGFLAQAAATEGRSAEALQAAREGAKLVTPHMTQMMPGWDFFRTPEMFVLTRFGRWDELLALPKPPETDLGSLGIWYFGQGMAHAAKSQVPQAEQALQALTRLREGLAPELLFDLNPAREVLGVAQDMLAGHIAWAKGNVARSEALLASAVKREDALSYAEPPDGFYPVRHHQAEAERWAGRGFDLRPSGPEKRAQMELYTLRVVASIRRMRLMLIQGRAGRWECTRGTDGSSSSPLS